MNTTLSQKTIEPNDPQEKSTKFKVIQNLMRNRYLSRQNKLKVLLSMKKNDEES